MDAIQFRQKAAHAREMAQFGDDIRLSRMLLEVARDLDAEAEAIEAEGTAKRRAPATQPPAGNPDALLYANDIASSATPVQIINLSIGGAKIHLDPPLPCGSPVTLELSSQGLRLTGTILRVRGAETVVAFDPAARNAPPNPFPFDQPFPV